MKKITDICFSGGSLKGISYCGVLQCLEETGIAESIKHVSGTSIGSYFALMFVCGYNSCEMKKFACHFDYNLLEDVDINYMFKDYGISSSRKIQTMIKHLLNRKGLYENITFLQLYEKTGIKLSMMCCRLNDHSALLFNYETYPNFRVYSACVMSMGLPIIFTRNIIGQDYIADGVFYKNLPIEIHDPEKTLGFSLVYPIKYTTINSFKDYIYQISICIFKKTQNLETELILSKGYHIVILETTVNSLDPNMSIQDRKSLISLGYRCTRDYLAKLEIGSN